MFKDLIMHLHTVWRSVLLGSDVKKNVGRCCAFLCTLPLSHCWVLRGFSLVHALTRCTMDSQHQHAFGRRFVEKRHRTCVEWDCSMPQWMYVLGKNGTGTQAHFSCQVGFRVCFHICADHTCHICSCQTFVQLSDNTSPGSGIRVKFIPSSFMGQLPAQFKPRRDETLSSSTCAAAKGKILKEVNTHVEAHSSMRPVC